ncbi:putative TonB-dependent receptor [Flavihumibacter petaseus NBRC 106054]|uniref:Putative TonB-dependent receptor n=2 Tax=Flavihumibacter TaxID=1004301 RepID=A0A0E9MVE7_9BACT|nr:putative TonB-dependent receptor [Flavihumibacter petaseus NBRC 106054]
MAQDAAKVTVTGILRDSVGAPLPQVTVTEKGTSNATSTGNDGRFTLQVAGERSVLVFTSVGYAASESRVGNRRNFDVSMNVANSGLGEVVVIGYGTKSKQSITAAVSTVTSKDLERVHGGATVSATLAGKLPGVTFRMPDGRPGSSANIQIRNMGTPLYVIDGIQQDAGQFNNLAPNDIESITILKDGAAAIYGVRAANGVVVVTTKRGAIGRNTVNFDGYAGIQNWTRFPDVLRNSYDYMYYRADAELNWFNSTNITPQELEKYKQGEAAGPQYRSFDWRDYVMQKNATQNSVNVNINGGNDKVNYYVSATNLYQNSVLGREYKFNRSNIQANVTAKVANGLRVGANINGRIETRQNPGVPGGDDYFLSRLAILRNTPRERPYANDNPAYLNDMGEHLESNYAFLNETISGKLRSDWRVLQTNFNVEWQVPGVRGLTLRGVYSYYIADLLSNNQEYTYDAYTYIPATDTTAEEYKRTGGATNPWRDREQIKQINTNAQGQVNYQRAFGEHNIGATFVAERIHNKRTRNWIHASPISNNLPLIYFPTMDQYQDEQSEEARIGYIGRVTYGYANRYFLEASVRRDASYLFQPGSQVGYFPGVSAGWRITEEPFMKRLLKGSDVLTDLKIRGSYGELGDDRNINGDGPIVAPYAYMEGYNYNQGTAIINGNAVTVSRDKGVPITRITWMTSKITDIGIDFGMFRGRLIGSVDWFNRKREGLLGTKNDVLVPVEIGYALPPENINSDASQGFEFSLNWTDRVGDWTYNVGGNVSYARQKWLDTYNPIFNNSWDQYRNDIRDRYVGIDWGYEVQGQFQSFEEINNYPVNIDGQGNRTMLPGDLIYKDQNGDLKIDQYDQRPVGYGYGRQPMVNFGFSLGLAWKNFDFHADFSGGSGYTWFQSWEGRWAFQNNGNLNTIFTDRWHREDIYDPNSAWVGGKYPANRYNAGFNHSNYGPQSDYWLHNVAYLRARTLELGYSIPAKILSKAKMQRARFYLNAYNMFSIDNMKQYGIDPEVVDDNGLQFPQNKVLNIGCNLTF